jgi:hypothetical protein
MKKIQFETSVGLVTGNLIDNERVHFDKENEALLDKLYRHTGVAVYDEKSGWITIELDDDFYGNPEYKATVL